jgi:DNA processing protein
MLKLTGLPDRLKHIPDPPQQLFTQGSPLEELLKKPCVTVVGSRKITPYGREVTERLVTGLARAGVVIISGLALGVDAIAHRAALDVNGSTIAVLPTSLDNIHPATNYQLALRIAEQGGTLVSEYPAGAPVRKWNFIQRNRIVSGLSDALLITEAGEKSGTLHTANFALEQGRDVFAVPGNITSPASAGTNSLIKSGAAPVTHPDDILLALGIRPTSRRATNFGNNPEEQLILDLLSSGAATPDGLCVQSRLSIQTLNQTLTMLEIEGKVRANGGYYQLSG